MSSFSSTRSFAATFSARSWCAGLCSSALVIFVYATSPAGSNSPVRIRIVKILTSAVSTTPSLRIPAWIASWMYCGPFSPPVQLSAVPARSAYACPPARPPTVPPVPEFVQVALSPLWSVVHPGGAQSCPSGGVLYVVPIAPQSEVMYPPNPSVRRASSLTV